MMHKSLEILLERYPQLKDAQANLEAAAKLLLEAAQAKKVILVAGNGGSAADAEHIVGELMKSFVLPRPLDTQLKDRLIEVDQVMGVHIATHLQQGIPAICLSSHTALSSAFANDVDSALSYAQQVVGYGSEDAVFWGISTSGSAKNVVQAAVTAKAMGMKVIGMTGRDGGVLKKYCDVCLRVPESETYKVQELHLPIYHWLCIYLEEMLYGV
jgi:D-sedoheptulose 7-phosphate isomerase